MRKIDLHVSLTFIKPFLTFTGVALGLFVVANALGNLENFMGADDPDLLELLRRMGLSYLCRLPQFISPLVPITVLIGGAFAVAYLARNNEITALKAGGVSIHRILTPVYICAAFFCLLGFANQELLVPHVEQRYLPQVTRWTKGAHESKSVSGRVIEEKASFKVDFNVVKGELTGGTVFIGEGDDITIVEAEHGVWTGEGWLLSGLENKGVAVTHAGRSEVQETYLWKTRLDPGALAAETMPLGSRALTHVVAELRGGGLDIARERQLKVTLYSRLAYPLVGVVLLLAGMPFMLQHDAVRRSRLVGVTLCVVLVSVFQVVRFFSNHLGEQGNLPPELAGFLPVILFGALGVFLSDQVRT